MQLRHIRPRSIDWVDAMDEGRGGRGWEKLAPEELNKLRMSAHSAHGRRREQEGDEKAGEGGADDYGWRAGSASR
jgi:hypothetical protein